MKYLFVLFTFFNLLYCSVLSLSLKTFQGTVNLKRQKKGNLIGLLKVKLNGIKIGYVSRIDILYNETPDTITLSTFFLTNVNRDFVIIELNQISKIKSLIKLPEANDISIILNINDEFVQTVTIDSTRIEYGDKSYTSATINLKSLDMSVSGYESDVIQIPLQQTKSKTAKCIRKLFLEKIIDMIANKESMEGKINFPSKVEKVEINLN
jgi:hypothetical protein